MRGDPRGELWGGAAVIATLLATVAACGHGRVLVGKDGQQRLTAADPGSGITVIATTGAWSGAPADLASEVTVLHVLVANNGDRPVLLAPGDLALEDRRGFDYDLLDPGATFFVAQTDEPLENVNDPGPLHHPGYARSTDEDYDLGAQRQFQWFEASGDIAELALPWGILEPGTQMRGFVYFEPMTENANGGTLTWTLGTPEHTPLMVAVFELGVSKTRRP